MQPADHNPSFSDRVIRSGISCIHWVATRDGKNRECYYFIMCTPQKLKMLKQIKEGIFAIKDYGIIVASGFGSVPSDKVIAMMKDKYGFDCTKLE